MMGLRTRSPQAEPDDAPGQDDGLGASIAKYGGGFALSILLTLASFWAAGSAMVWQPGVPILLAALAIGQMGVHLVFFLHVSSGPEGTNNILALAFGVFVVALVVFGSIVIMANLDANMMPAHRPMVMQG